MTLKKALTVPIPRLSRRIEMRWPARYMALGDECWNDCVVIDLPLGVNLVSRQRRVVP